MVSRAHALLLLVALVGACKKGASETEDEDHDATVKVHCTPVASGPIVRVVRLRGRISPAPGGDLSVAALVAGKVMSVVAKEGDHVESGAIVALVDDLAPRAAATEAQASLAHAVAARAEAAANLNRNLALEPQHMVSKADLETARAHLESANADVAAEQAKTGLAAGNLSRIEVRAPFAGVVTKIWRGAGALVDGTNQTPIIQITSESSLEFSADGTESETSLLTIGDEAEVSVGPSTKPFSARVIALPRNLDAKTGLGTIRLAFDPGDRANELKALPMGSFGQARVSAQPIASGLSIPREALRTAVLDGAEVATCNGDKSAIKKITVGYHDEKVVEVLSGLAKGDQVATGDILGLSDGAAISLASAEPSAGRDADDEK